MNADEGYAALHFESGLLLNVCGSATNVVGFPVGVDDPAAVDRRPGLCFDRLVVRRDAVDVSALTSATHWMNTGHAASACTGPRHITWLSALPFCFAIRSRIAKWNH